MEHVLFIVLGLLSCSVAVASVIISFILWQKERNTKNCRKYHFFTPFRILFIGTIIAAILMYYPVLFNSAHLEAGSIDKNINNPFMIFLMSVRSAMGLFVVGENFETVKEAVADQSPFLSVPFSIYAGIIFIVAPILTAAAVILTIKTFWYELIFNYYKKRRNLYIMSELNDMSIILAKSIKEHYQHTKEKPLIVFANVNDKKTKNKYLDRIKKINAIYLGKKIAEMDIKDLKNDKRREIFITGENESEKISETMRLVSIFNKCSNTHIFIYSPSEETGVIIDSLDKGFDDRKKYRLKISSPSIRERNLTFMEKKRAKSKIFLKDILFPPVENSDLWSQIKKNPEKFLFENGIRDFFKKAKNSEKTKDTEIYTGFEVKRIDPEYLLCMDILSEKIPRFLTRGRCKEEKEKKINDVLNEGFSITIIGLGSVGKKILKTASWLYQIYDDKHNPKLEINAIDVSDTIFQKLKYECPDLHILGDNESTKSNGINYNCANYDIKLFDKVDCFSDDFCNIFDYHSNRFKKTQVVFVLLGDDEKNMKISIKVREIFSKLLGTNDGNKPVIYSILYDEYDYPEDGSNIIFHGKKSIKLKNYKNNSYNIKFIGNLDYQYDYKLIESQKEHERDALACHFDWAGTHHYLRKQFETNSSFKDELKKRNMNGDKFNDKYFYINNDPNNAINLNEIMKLLKLYYCFEYYRLSSIAKAVHRSKIVRLFLENELNHFEIQMGHNIDDTSDKERSRNYYTTIHFDCPVCETIRRTEHMRWCAYMQAAGYRYGDKRNDMAKVHSLLVDWERLKKENYLDIFKD